MIIGAHSLIYSVRPEADRAFLRDVLGLSHIDAGDGWLIFGLPPAELAVHPSERNDIHELYLMCADVAELVSIVARHNIDCGPVQDRGWGLITHVTLPGGGKLGIYQPLHPRPEPVNVARRAISRKKTDAGKAHSRRVRSKAAK